MENKRRRFPLALPELFRKHIAITLTLLLVAGLSPVDQQLAYADVIKATRVDRVIPCLSYIIDSISLGTTSGEHDNRNTIDSIDIVARTTTTSGVLNESPSYSIAPTSGSVPSLCTISSAINPSKVLDIPGGLSNVGVGVQLWDNIQSIAQRFQIIPNSDGTYTIRNVNSNLVLDVRWAEVYNGAVVWQYTANGSTAQKWYISSDVNGYKLASAINPTYCLDVQWAIASNGTPLQLWADNGATAQRFILKETAAALPDGAYTISSYAANNLAIDVRGASSSNFSVVQLYTYNSSLAQRFWIAYDYSCGFYTITNVQSNKPLDVSGASKASGASVQIYDPNNNPAQKWAITALATNRYSITAAHSGMVLGVGYSLASSTPIQTYMWDGALNQQWVFTSSTLINEGAYQIKSDLGVVIDAQGNGVVNYTPIWAYGSTGSMAQKFYLSQFTDGYFKLECLNSSLLVTASGSDVFLFEDRNLPRQIWKVQPVGEGRFKLLNSESGLALSLVESSTAAGVKTLPLANNNRQSWSFELTRAIPDGLYVIHSAIDTSMVLDVRLASVNNGTKLQLYKANGSTAQTFKFEYVGNFFYRITGLGSSKAVDIREGVLSPKGIIQIYDAWGGNDNRYQLWRVEYVGQGSYRIFSAAGNGILCMTLEGDSTANSTDVNALPVNGSSSQLFKLTPKGNAFYFQLQQTVSQMVQYQRNGNSYINDITDSQLRDVIDPSLATNDYWFPGHAQQYTNGMLQFADLRGYTGMSASQLDSIINAYSPATSTLRGKGAVFIQAAILYNINECYLLAHCALESGWGMSSLSQGYDYDGIILVNGKTWPIGRYYNLFGIGAVDSGPLTGGRAYAISNGWNTIDSAIIGGAKWIIENYIYRDAFGLPYPQQTLYAMKWDYLRSNDTQAYGWHQYATDHLWARKISRLMGDFYIREGVTPNLTYIVPVYKVG
jgi:beta-N-acetylglucosaminidase